MRKGKKPRRRFNSTLDQQKIACPICWAIMARNTYGKHIFEYHPGTRATSAAARPRPLVTLEDLATYFLGKAAARGRSSTETRSDSDELLLFQKSGYLSWGNCQVCTAVDLPVQNISTNRGILDFCADCMAEALDRTFGPVDAFSFAVEAGQFESNPRRH